MFMRIHIFEKRQNLTKKNATYADIRTLSANRTKFYNLYKYKRNNRFIVS